MTELRLIAQIGRFGAVSAKEISDKISVDQVAISRAVAKCIRRGLVRETPNPMDRRSKSLALTRSGEKLFESFLPQACALAARMESGLTVGETHALKALLKKLDAHLSKIVIALQSGGSERTKASQSRRSKKNAPTQLGSAAFDHPRRDRQKLRGRAVTSRTSAG